MPKRSSNKMTRSNARKLAKAKRAVKRTPYAGKYGSKPRVGKTKMLVKQESLGTQTQNTVRMGPITKGDSRARYIKAVSARSTFNKIAQYSLVGGVTGLQAIYTSYIAPQSDLKQMADSLQNLLYSGTASTGTAVNQPARFLLEDVHNVYDFSNRSSAPCTLKLYIISAKRDTWYSASTPMMYTSPNAALVTWNGEPDDAFRAGIQAQSDPFQSTPGNNDWLNPGIVPTQSVIFNQYFKIDKEIEIELATGGVHQLDLRCHYDKICDASVYASTPLVGVRGITRFLMATAIGTPVVIDGQTADMTTSAVNIGVILTKKYSFTQSASPVAVAFQDGNELAQVNAFQVNQINPGSGLASAVVDA